jgi:hypothetical protein
MIYLNFGQVKSTEEGDMTATPDTIKIMEAFAKAPRELVKALEDLAMLPANIWEKYGSRSEKNWLRDFNIFLTNRVMFTPNGISGALQNFCDDPSRRNWSIVQNKLDDGQIVITELNKMLTDKAKNKRFFSEHTEFLKIINAASYKKGGMQGTIGHGLAMPKTPAEIKALRASITSMNKVNDEIKKVRSAIEGYLKKTETPEH